MLRIGGGKSSMMVFALVLGLVLIKVMTPRAAQTEIMSYSTATTVSLHEPVVISFTINNVLSETLSIDLGLHRKGAFQIVVTSPHGERLSLSPLAKVREGIAGPTSVTLDPGQSYRQLLVVNEWYEFSKPGKYLIEVELANSPQTQAGSIVSVGRKIRATVEVVARDLERLRGVSESLMRQVLASKSYQEAAETADVLSYVKDPVAVHYLRSALESNKMVEAYCIAGLRRIGNSEAAQVLISIMTKQEGETAMMARNALFALEAESIDPSIRQQIKRAMKRTR